MIRHQTVRMNGASKPCCKRSQQAQVVAVVPLGEKAQSAVDTTLHQMQCNAGQDKSGRSGHDSGNEPPADSVDSPCEKWGTSPFSMMRAMPRVPMAEFE